MHEHFTFFMDCQLLHSNVSFHNAFGSWSMNNGICSVPVFLTAVRLCADRHTKHRYHCITEQRKSQFVCTIFSKSDVLFVRERVFFGGNCFFVKKRQKRACHPIFRAREGRLFMMRKCCFPLRFIFVFVVFHKEMNDFLRM